MWLVDCPFSIFDNIDLQRCWVNTWTPNNDDPFQCNEESSLKIKIQSGCVFLNSFNLKMPKLLPFQLKISISNDGQFYFIKRIIAGIRRFFGRIQDISKGEKKEKSEEKRNKKQKRKVFFLYNWKWIRIGIVGSFWFINHTSTSDSVLK